MLTEKENLKTLNKRIKNLKLNGKIIIAFDFDELVVPIHLTRSVTRKIAKPVNLEMLQRKGSLSFEALLYLNSLLIGCDYSNYKKVRDQTAKETKWTEGFENLIKDLATKHTVIFISSGLKDICESKLKEIGFDPNNILGSELKIEDNEIVGSDLVISDELKGYIISELKKNHKVISIGHSLGDKAMLDKSNVSISYNSSIPDLAKFNVKSSKEIMKIIQDNC